MSLTACSGMFDGVYDEPPADRVTLPGQLYIDASSWTEWHFLDITALPSADASDESIGTSEAWTTIPIDTEGIDDPGGMPPGHSSGIYTYWYDVFGEGIGKYEFRNFRPTRPQREPEKWTIAVHRNNVRTNGCQAAATSLRDINDLPPLEELCAGLSFSGDEWNQTDVWTIQDRMLQGIVGNQGIETNPVLSTWLHLDIPPVPPAFTIDRRVYVLRLPDNTYAALQLADYQNALGDKCHLTINYKYPL